MTTPASDVAQPQTGLLADESVRASPGVPVETPPQHAFRVPVETPPQRAFRVGSVVVG